MDFWKLLSEATFLLTCLSLTVASRLAGKDVGRAAAVRACDDYRREMTTLLQHAYETKAGPHFLKKFIPKWVELSLPINCRELQDLVTTFSPSTFNNKNLPMRTLGAPSDTFAMSVSTRQKLETTKDNAENIRAKRSVSATGDIYANSIIREKRGTREHDVANHVEGNVLFREKRFLAAGPDFSALSLTGTAGGGTGQDVSDATQMMNNLLMFTKMQKNNAAREYGLIGRQRGSYGGDRVSFGTGIYGDVYTGRRKREAPSFNSNEAPHAKASALSSANSRQKRFIFAEPAEGPPSLFSIFLGTARDPNTGKRMEFSGDLIKHTLGNTLLGFLPPGMQPTPGKEPGDIVKSMAPLLLGSHTGSAGSFKRQNRNGLFGDNLPGKKRRKRSPRDSSNTV